MKSFLVLLSFISLAFSANAQVSIIEDAGITMMLSRYIEVNQSTTEVSGWRLQLLATNDRQKVMDAKANFLRTFPQYGADWVYKAPYYKLNVGAFRTKREANALKHELNQNYPNSYITKDNSIKPSELN